MKVCRTQKICICVDAYKCYEKDDFDEIYKVLSTLKNKISKINKILIEKYKDVRKSCFRRRILVTNINRYIKNRT